MNKSDSAIGYILFAAASCWFAMVVPASGAEPGQREERTVAHQSGSISINQARTQPSATAQESKAADGLAKSPSSDDIKTVKGANKAAGASIDPSLMAQPQLEPPIKGFHPVKKIMRPVENLARQSVDLGQEIMRLEGPIASLQPSMLKLDDRMNSVENQMISVQGRMKQMQGNLVNTQTEVSRVRSDMGTIDHQMGGVRNDLSAMQTQIVGLQKPIKDLRDPIVRLNKPLTAVADPVSHVEKRLDAVDEQLSALKSLLATILFSIYVAAITVAAGTPIAAFIVYKNRRKLFPNSQDKDLTIATGSK